MKIYTDGSTTRYCFLPEGEGPRVYDNPKGATHNQSEYLAIIAALIWYAQFGFRMPSELEILSDSEWAIKQLNGQYKVKDDKAIILHHIAQQVRSIAGLQVTFTFVPRLENLAGLVLDEKQQES